MLLLIGICKGYIWGVNNLNTSNVTVNPQEEPPKKREFGFKYI